MGRKKIQINCIADERMRCITFNKRKAGLLKKAAELAMLCNIQICLTFTDVNGNLINFFSPNMEMYDELKKFYPYKRVLTFTKEDYPDFFKNMNLKKAKKEKAMLKEAEKLNSQLNQIDNNSTAKINDEKAQQQACEGKMDQELTGSSQQEGSCSSQNKLQPKKKLKIEIPQSNQMLAKEMNMIKLIHNLQSDKNTTAPASSNQTAQTQSDEPKIDQVLNNQDIVVKQDQTDMINNPTESFNNTQQQSSAQTTAPTQTQSQQAQTTASQSQQPFLFQQQQNQSTTPGQQQQQTSQVPSQTPQTQNQQNSTSQTQQKSQQIHNQFSIDQLMDYQQNSSFNQHNLNNDQLLKILLYQYYQQKKLDTISPQIFNQDIISLQNQKNKNYNNFAGNGCNNCNSTGMAVGHNSGCIPNNTGMPTGQPSGILGQSNFDVDYQAAQNYKKNYPMQSNIDSSNSLNLIKSPTFFIDTPESQYQENNNNNGNNYSLLQQNFPDQPQQQGQNSNYNCASKQFDLLVGGGCNSNGGGGNAAMLAQTGLPQYASCGLQKSQAINERLTGNFGQSCNQSNQQGSNLHNQYQMFENYNSQPYNQQPPQKNFINPKSIMQMYLKNIIGRQASHSHERRDEY